VSEEDTAIERVAAALAKARGVVVITGAGISAESGLRTFRGNEKDMESLWKQFDPMTLATPEAFVADPETVTRWYDWRRLGCLAAEPNPGHVALARMERGVTGGQRRGRFTLLTQNVDRLHQRAGSQRVVELHGSIIEWRCAGCGKKETPGGEAMAAFPPVPSCCADEHLRPDVVWFGEALPFEALAAADEAVAGCDLFFSIGTSSVVYPAAGYVQIAARRGAMTVEVNKDPTPISGMVDFSLRGKAGESLPRIVELAFGRS
jgi:NAD-dependent deacetylase